MPRPLPSPLLALILAAFSCSGSQQPASDSSPSPSEVTPEKRFGNDTELVSRIAELGSCVIRGQASAPAAGPAPRVTSPPSAPLRLDASCAKLKELKRRLETKRREEATHARVIATLTNLLESGSAVTRLIAADSLPAPARDAQTLAALDRALQRERTPAVKCVMLRQRCWSPDASVRSTALGLLGASAPDELRQEAVACLGRTSSSDMPAAVSAALRQTLKRDPSAQVRGEACAALGAAKVAGAVPEMTAALASPDVVWRCATALAAIGNEPAYRALMGAVAGAMERAALEAPLVSAVASFAGDSFFAHGETIALLARAAGERRLRWTARQRAVSELGRLGAREELRKLLQAYRGAVGEEDATIRGELEVRAAGR